jgi:opacity protein-like surface antigen
MKTLVALAVLATAIATPALAQTAQQRTGDAVISGSKYLGTDPDANVRFDLLREQNWRNGGY